MADFDVNTITVQGAIAIASATAGDKLVIDGCDAVTDVFTQAQAVQIATRPVSPASTTDTIGLAGSTDNHVYAYASFIRGESTGGDVHSFLLYGHMESDETTVFVVAVASATAPTHIPTSSDVTNRVEIQFELTFSATDEVVTVTDTSMYTTRGEFLILKNRTVTTHAEGQATVGEDQTVYGNKDFKDAVDFNSIYTVQASRTETQGGTDNTNTLILSPKPSNGMGTHFVAMTKDDGTDYMSSEATMSAGSLMIVSGGAMFDASHTSNNTQASVVASGGMNQATAGVEVKPTQVTLYTQAAGSNARRTLSYTGGQLTGSFDTIGTSHNELNIYVRASAADIDMYFDATVHDATWSVDLTNVNDNKTATLTFYAGADSGGQLTCVSDAPSKLGTSSTPWDEANIAVLQQADNAVLIDNTGVSTDNLNPKNNTTIDVNGGLMPGNNGVSLGSGTKKWNELYVSVAHVDGNIQASTLRSDSNEMQIYAFGSTSGYSDHHSELYLLCDDPADPCAKILLKSSSESVETEYTFGKDAFHATGKNLGYPGGGEWNNVYANNVYASGIASLHDIQTDIIRKRGGTGNIGLWANLVPNTTDPVSLGSTSFSFSDVYANKLHGIMPYMDGTGSTPPIGAFFLACIDTVSTGPAFMIGDVLDMSQPGVYGISTLTVANNVDATTWTASTSWRITTGKYAVLSNGKAQTATRVICLLMRIE